MSYWSWIAAGCLGALAWLQVQSHAFQVVACAAGMFGLGTLVVGLREMQGLLKEILADSARQAAKADTMREDTVKLLLRLCQIGKYR